VKIRVGEMVSITTYAIYVKGFVQDLIFLMAGKSLNQGKIRIILDEDLDVSGIYSGLY
jgi:hypothetical protein